MTRKPKICVYTIALNEEKHVDSFMKANGAADYVVISDTGSTDFTVERLQDQGATVYEITQAPWRFDIARNTSLNLVPADADLCLAIDMDEQLQPGWRDHIEKAWADSKGAITRISYKYTWNWKPDGVTPDVQFFTDKMHHRKGYIWRHPCHETLYWKGSGAEMFVRCEELELHHHADNSKPRSQYLGLLQLAVEEDPSNDRMRHYFARELMFVGRLAEAIENFEKHLVNPAAVWAEERAASLRYISRCKRGLGDDKGAVDAALRGVFELDTSREAWLELARAAYHKHDWRTCYWAAAKCLAIETRTFAYTADAAAWGSEPYDLAGIAAWHIGYADAAKINCAKALELNPGDPRLRKNCILVGAIV